MARDGFAVLHLANRCLASGLYFYANPVVLTQITIRPTSEEVFASHKPLFPPLPPSAQLKPNVDRSFLRQLRAILRVAFPSYTSKETGIVLLHSVFLVMRTVLSVYVAKLDGRIVRDLVCIHPL